MKHLHILIATSTFYLISLTLIPHFFENISYTVPIISLIFLAFAIMYTIIKKPIIEEKAMTAFKLIISFAFISIAPFIICLVIYYIQDFVPIGLIGALFSWLVQPAVWLGAPLICASSIWYIFIINYDGFFKDDNQVK